MLVLIVLIMFSDHLHIGLIQFLLYYLGAVLNESLMNFGLRLLPFLLLAAREITIQQLHHQQSSFLHLEIQQQAFDRII